MQKANNCIFNVQNSLLEVDVAKASNFLDIYLSKISDVRNLLLLPNVHVKVLSPLSLHLSKQVLCHRFLFFPIQLAFVSRFQCCLDFIYAHSLSCKNFSVLSLSCKSLFTCLIFQPGRLFQ